MPLLPAFCNRCGAIFSSGIEISNGASASLSGNMAGPCPRCFGMGTIPDGKFTSFGNVIRLISGPERTIEQFRQLEAILADAHEKRKSAQQIASQIKKDAPVWEFLIKYFLPTNAGELYTLIALILAVIALLPSQRESLTEKQISSIVQNAVSSAIEQTTKAAQKDRAEATREFKMPSRNIKVGRSQPCPCGSGKKHKRCCGRTQPAQ